MASKEPIYLGINAVFHETAAAVVVGDRLVAAAEEERFNRVKHGKKADIDNGLLLPFGAIDWCLSHCGATLADVTAIGYSFSPRLRLEHNCPKTAGHDTEESDWGTVSGERRFHDMVRLSKRVLERWGRTNLEGRFHFLPHHGCHLASAFRPSPFDEAAIISVDGIGEWSTTAIAHGRGHEMEVLWETNFPHSLGFLWEKFTAFLGFRRNHDECKVMGLASYGDPTVYRSAFSSLITVDETGFSIDDDLLRFRREDDYSSLEQLFGPARLAHEELAYGSSNKRHADIAAALQAVTTDALLALATKAHGLTKARHCCLAGGVALNCVANGVLATAGPFDDLWIQPAAHDAGTAVGAALELAQLRHGRRAGRTTPYLGPSYPASDCQQAIATYRLSDAIVPTDDLCSEVAKLLADGAVVAHFNGSLEFGPRALGNRSILADPRNAQMRDILNQRVKHREDFRPFCPSVLADHAADWFEFGSSQSVLAAEHMLVAYATKADRRAAIPAVVHVDGTSRIQVVHAEVNPRFHELISCFHRLTGVPLVLNTSFNDREPIVCTPTDAIRCFLNTEIDYLVLGDTLLSRAEARHA